MPLLFFPNKVMDETLQEHAGSETLDQNTDDVDRVLATAYAELRQMERQLDGKTQGEIDQWLECLKQCEPDAENVDEVAEVAVVNMD